MQNVRDRQTSSMSDGSCFKWPKQPIPGQELFWVAHMERRGPSSRASLHCLPRYTGGMWTEVEHPSMPKQWLILHNSGP